MYCKIIVPVPIKKEYTYECPKNLTLKRGDVVEVPFGRRKSEIGLVYSIIKKPEIKIFLRLVSFILIKK